MARTIDRAAGEVPLGGGREIGDGAAAVGCLDGEPEPEAACGTFGQRQQTVTSGDVGADARENRCAVADHERRSAGERRRVVDGAPGERSERCGCDRREWPDRTGARDDAHDMGRRVEVRPGRAWR